MPPLPRLLHHHLSLSLLRRHSPRQPCPPAAYVFLHRGLASSSSPASAAAAGREKSSRRTLAYLLGVAAAMVSASYAAIPLYRRFCQATGYGGTVQRREGLQDQAMFFFSRSCFVDPSFNRVVCKRSEWSTSLFTKCCNLFTFMIH